MLLSEFGIEIASSFGALESVLLRHGAKVDAGAGLQAAMDVYEAGGKAAFK